MRFLSASDLAEPLAIAIGLSGASGSGKTYSAMRIAKGIAAELGGEGAPFAFVDTENRRGLHHRASFPEMLHHYIDFGPEEDGEMIGYPPKRWATMLDFIEESTAAAVVIDSASHAWEGIGGVLDAQAEVHAGMGGGEKDSLRAWGRVKPGYRKDFVNRIIQSRIPMVICTRAKSAIPDPKRPGKNLLPTKTRRDDIPFDIAGDKDLLFEMTTMTILDPLHPGCPLYQVKVGDEFKSIFPPDRPLSEETGRAMARWTRDQKSAAESKALLDAARAAARGGKDALQEHWMRLGQADRAVVTVIMDELKTTALAADAAPKDAGAGLDETAAEEKEALG